MPIAKEKKVKVVKEKPVYILNSLPLENLAVEEPCLYKKRKDDKWQSLQITSRFFKDDTNTLVETVHGTEDGKKQLDAEIIFEGKNIGKKNQTNRWEQTLLEAKSKWERKRDEGYTATKDVEVVFLPMLAYEFNDRIESHFKNLEKGKFLDFYIQPKLDGVRGVCRRSNGKLCMFTRKGKDISVPCSRILKKLEPYVTEDFYLDGEVYSNNTEWTIQEIAGTVNKKSFDPRFDSLQFVAYDAYYKDEPDLNYKNRFLDRHVFKKDNHLTSCYLDGEIACSIYEYSFSWGTAVKASVSSLEALQSILDTRHRLSIEKGFEGLIVRLAEAPYAVNQRTHNLLKYKKFHDGEFLVTDIKELKTGREAGTGVFVCVTENGVSFNAPSVGTRDLRKDIVGNREFYIGKMVTVQYQDLTNDLVPRFPKAIVLRDYEDPGDSNDSIEVEA